jgi:hypothetical protein
MGLGSYWDNENVLNCDTCDDRKLFEHNEINDYTLERDEFLCKLYNKNFLEVQFLGG